MFERLLHLGVMAGITSVIPGKRPAKPREGIWLVSPSDIMGAPSRPPDFNVRPDISNCHWTCQASSFCSNGSSYCLPRVARDLADRPGARADSPPFCHPTCDGPATITAPDRNGRAVDHRAAAGTSGTGPDADGAARAARVTDRLPHDLTGTASPRALDSCGPTATLNVSQLRQLFLADSLGSRDARY